MSAGRLVPDRRPAIWQPRQPVFWLLAALLVGAGAMTVLELVMIGADAQAALAALLLLAVQTAVFGFVAWAMPRFRRQPASLRLAALAWGLAVVPTLAILASGSARDVLDALGWSSFASSVSAPINEDLLRLLGVLLVLTLASRTRLTVMDGALYGFIVGAGFELVENLLYALRGDDFASTVTVGLTRLVVGLGLHALWTALAGAALAYCLSRRQAGLPARWWALAPAILVPMLLHAGWDAPSPSIFPFIKFALFFVLYAVSVAVFLFATRWGRRSEFAWYRAVSGSALSLPEFKELPRAERRRLAAEAVGAERAGEAAAQ